MSAGAQRVHSVAQWLDGATEWWLGWTLPPASRAVEESQWKPDQATEYCARCGASTGAGEVDVRGCAACRGTRLIYNRCVRIGAYAPPLAHWITAVKYQQWGEMAGLLGQKLGLAVRETEAIDPQRTLVVPMPMPWQRRLYRGIDHAALIARAVSEALEAPVMPALVKRNGRPQVGLPHASRGSNLAGQFRFRPRLGVWPIEGADVVLVDDVRTTGATLRAAAKLLRTLRPRKIIAAVIAAADDDSRRPRHGADVSVELKRDAEEMGVQPDPALRGASV